MGRPRLLTAPGTTAVFVEVMFSGEGRRTGGLVPTSSQGWESEARHPQGALRKEGLGARLSLQPVSLCRSLLWGPGSDIDRALPKDPRAQHHSGTRPLSARGGGAAAPMQSLFFLIYLLLIQRQLQYCVGFCHAPVRISHRHTDVPPH